MDLVSLIGQTLDGKYVLESLVGRGGMGAVYRARHLGIERPVALKVIAPEFLRDPQAAVRFAREARAAGRLQHPNVVNVTDFGVAATPHGQVAYLVMEMLRGLTLGRLLETEGRLPLRVAVDLVEQVALALDEAHRAGVVHRDIKPDNIWLEPDYRGGYRVKVLDFGLAKLRDEELAATQGVQSVPDVAPIAPDEATIQIDGMGDATVARSAGSSANSDATQAGTLVGTPAYMSPEQCRGEVLDARSDIYSLGVVVYHMLAGERPFSGNTAVLLSRHREDVPPDLRAKRPDVPKGVADLVMSALAKDPAQRPASARVFAAAFRAHAEPLSVLLRRSVAMAAEHFDAIAALWATAVAGPVLGFLAVAAAAAVTLPFHAAAGVLSVAAFAALSALNGFASGLFVVATRRLRERPLEQFDLAAVVGELRARTGAAGAGTLQTLLASWRRRFRAEVHSMRRQEVKGELAFIAALLEGCTEAEAAERAAVLARRLPDVLGFTRIAVLTIFATLGLIVGMLIGAGELTIERVAGIALAGSAVCLAAGAIVLPLYVIASTLFYFTARDVAEAATPSAENTVPEGARSPVATGEAPTAVRQA